jgi:nitrogen fixation protein FixH
MKVELALSVVEGRVWKGLTLIDGELFKVSIFPGSATTDWDAEVVPMTYVECDPGNKLAEAIERAVKMWELREKVPEEDFRVMIRVINEHPEMLEEIREALQKKGGE